MEPSEIYECFQFTLGDKVIPSFETGDAEVPSQNLEKDWVQHVSPDGTTYYLNKVTAAVSIEHPGPDKDLGDKTLNLGPILLGLNFQSEPKQTGSLEGETVTCNSNTPITSSTTHKTPTAISKKTSDDSPAGAGSFPHGNICSAVPSESIETTTPPIEDNKSHEDSKETDVNSSKTHLQDLTYTDPRDFAKPYLLDMHKLKDGTVHFSSGVVCPEDVKTKIANPPDGYLTTDSMQWSLKIVCLQSANVSEGIHTSKEDFEALTQILNLPQDLAWYARSLKMSAEQLKVPLGSGCFFSSTRAATSVNNSTLLSYRYSAEDQAVTGILIGPGLERKSFLQKLQALSKSVAVAVLPIMTLAHHSTARTSSDLERHLDFYYAAKQIIGLDLGERHAERRTFGFKHHFYHLVKPNLEMVNSCIELQISSNQGLIQTVRENYGESIDTFCLDVLRAMEARNQGASGVVHRIRRRLNENYANDMAQLQMKINRDVLSGAERRGSTLVASNSSLQMMKDHTEALKDLSQKQDSLARSAAKYGTLVMWMTAIQTLVTPLGALAEIFGVYEHQASHGGTYWGVATTIVVFIVFLMGWVYIRKDKQNKEEHRSTPSIELSDKSE